MVMREMKYVAPSGTPAGAMYQRILARDAAIRADILAAHAQMTAPVRLAPVEHEDRSRNPLRPRTFDGIVGQRSAKKLLRAALSRSQATGEPLPHTLLVGPAGTGKSTFAHVIATELGVHVYQLAAPVGFDTMLQLRDVMFDRDVLFLDEIHQQAIQERRGRDSATSPEVLYGVLEDRVIPTARGVLSYPAITMIGGTTDEGLLPDAFLSRFPLRPRLIAYTAGDLQEIARRNARTLGASYTERAVEMIAVASRGVPREVNNLIANTLAFSQRIDAKLVREVLEMNGIEESDGLSADMAALLRFVYLTGRHQLRSGEVRYQASVSSIAVGIGKSRDTKAVTLRIEPYLIQRGYLQILAGSGRRLTDRGIERAQELLSGGTR